jgi:hypothetical protein
MLNRERQPRYDTAHTYLCLPCKTGDVSDANTGLDDPGNCGSVSLFGGARPDLRSKLPDLPASLSEGRWLHCLRLHIHGSMQSVGIGARSPMPRQSILCARTSSEALHSLGPVPDGQIRYLPRFRLPRFVQPSRERYFYFAFSGVVLHSSRSAPTQGAYASSRTWSGMRWTRAVPTGERLVRGRSRVVLARPCRRQVRAKLQRLRADDGGKRWFTGEREVSRKPSRRKAGCYRLYLWFTRARANFFARGPRVQRPPGLPCALVFDEGDE